jgi:hypothetical protein
MIRLLVDVIDTLVLIYSLAKFGRNFAIETYCLFNLLTK